MARRLDGGEPRDIRLLRLNDLLRPSSTLFGSGRGNGTAERYLGQDDRRVHGPDRRGVRGPGSSFRQLQRAQNPPDAGDGGPDQRARAGDADALADELQAKTVEFRERRKAGESLEDLLPEAFAAARESGRRYLNMRHFDVQLMGGMVLHGGNIAEMVTGRRQDAGRHAGRLLERPGRPRRARGDGQRLPGPPRRRMDEPAVSRAGDDGGGDSVGDGFGRAPEDVRLRHHLRNEQRIRLRLPARQHEADQGVSSRRAS